MKTWVDEAEIKVGDRLRDKIEQGIEESDFMVVVLSKASTHRGWKSSRWVHTEIDAVFIEDTQRWRTTLLPCRIENCRVPTLLSGLYHADFATKGYADAYALLLSSVMPSRAAPAGAGLPPDVRRLVEDLWEATPDGQANAAYDVASKAAALSTEQKRTVITALERAFMSPHQPVRLQVVKSLKHFGDDPVTPLTAALQDEDPDVIGWACHSLGAMAATAAVPQLVATLRHPEGKARANAARALGEIGSTDAVKPLVTVLQEDLVGGVRANAADALGKIGEEAAASALTDALGDDHGPVRERAAEALGRMRYAAAAAHMEAMLTDPYEQARQAAQNALDSISTDGP